MSSVIGPAPSSEVRTHTTRFVSIDIFRGLTMTLMIYVNELAGVKGLPWWNYHAPAQVDVMTYVDMVFPAFLFILGMTIPVALDGRLEKNDGSIMRVLLHVFQRTVALVVLGFNPGERRFGKPETDGNRQQGLGDSCSYWRSAFLDCI